MTLYLDSAPNPDFGEKAKPAPRKRVEVDSLYIAREHCRMYKRMFNLGGGNWGRADVFSNSGEHVARFSYNLRCWKPSTQTVYGEEITL